MAELLKLGQVIKIKQDSYIVLGMIEYKEDTWIWQEYKIRNQETNQIKWLNIEEDGAETVYSLYEMIRSRINFDSIEINFKDEMYKLYESGTTYVNKYFGQVDVEIREKCQYKEYANEGKDKFVSQENWESEEEISIGEKINTIEVTQEIHKVSSVNTKGSILFIIISMIITLLLGFLIFSSLFVNKSVRKYIEKDSDFSYETSVTNNQSNKKTRVYTTNLTLESAVEKIIGGVPEGITKVVEEQEDGEEGIGLFTKNEYIYVYYSEDNTTMVQITKTKDVNNSSKVYRGRSTTYRHYLRTYNSTNNHTDYTTQLNSARQSSINARKSSGGGTSSGK